MNKHSTYPLETILEDIWLAEHPVGDPAGPDGMPMYDHIFVQAMRPRHLDTFLPLDLTQPLIGPTRLISRLRGVLRKPVPGAAPAGPDEPPDPETSSSEESPTGEPPLDETQPSTAVKVTPKASMPRSKMRPRTGSDVKTFHQKLDDLQAGDRVAFWRQARRNRGGVGYAHAGYQMGTFSHYDPGLAGRSQGKNVWVVSGGRLLLVSREQLRRAVGFEQWDPSAEDIAALRSAEKLIAEGNTEDVRQDGPPVWGTC